LILASGARCAAHIAETFWKDPETHAVDYDPEIIKAGNDIYNFKKSKLSFIVDDAVSFMKRVEKKYDFVVVDIFVQNKVSPLIISEEFTNSVKNILSDKSNIVINVSIGKEDLDTFSVLKRVFPTIDILKHRANYLLVSKTRLIPEDYSEMFQSELYSRGVVQRGYTVIGTPGQQALVQSLFGFAIASFLYTDIEPDVLSIKKAGFKHGIIFWVPLKSRFISNNTWMKCLTPSASKGRGVSLVAENYQEKWSETARRDLKKFQSAPVEIVVSEENSFLYHLKYSVSDTGVQRVVRSLVKNFEKEVVKYWIAKEKNGEVLGGLAIIDYENSSYNVASYITKKGISICTGTGLVAQWYQYALENKIKYLNFGHMREKGDPRSWEGFSNFKRKFIDIKITLSSMFFSIKASFELLIIFIKTCISSFSKPYISISSNFNSISIASFLNLELISVSDFSTAFLTLNSFFSLSFL